MRREAINDEYFKLIKASMGVRHRRPSRSIVENAGNIVLAGRIGPRASAWQKNFAMRHFAERVLSMKRPASKSRMSCHHDRRPLYRPLSFINAQWPNAFHGVDIFSLHCTFISHFSCIKKLESDGNTSFACAAEACITLKPRPAG